MIFHKQIVPPESNGSVEWLAVDADTLTIARCSVRKATRLYIEIIRPLAAAVAASSHPVHFDLGESAISILCDCRETSATLKSTPAEVSLIPEGQIEIPEYILLNRECGDMPAIMHTRDPLFIAMDPWELEDSNHPPAYFRSSVDLPPEGWKYWCTDAYQEFERLADELLPVGTAHSSLRGSKQAVR